MTSISARTPASTVGTAGVRFSCGHAFGAVGPAPSRVPLVAQCGIESGMTELPRWQLSVGQGKGQEPRAASPCSSPRPTATSGKAEPSHETVGDDFTRGWLKQQHPIYIFENVLELIFGGPPCRGFSTP